MSVSISNEISLKFLREDQCERRSLSVRDPFEPKPDPRFFKDTSKRYVVTFQKKERCAAIQWRFI